MTGSNWTGRTPRLAQPGDRFGLVTVLREAEPMRQTNGRLNRLVVVKCDCGTEKAIALKALSSGSTVSCGCFHRVAARSTALGNFVTHGRSRTPLYVRWQAMISRCHSETNSSYWRYGARGVQVCDRWRESFSNFLVDMGEIPPGMSLDRFPNYAGNYEPGNVRWATSKEQARNTRRNHLHTINGETKCLAEWCEILNVPWSTVKKRVSAGRNPFVRLRQWRSF